MINPFELTFDAIYLTLTGQAPIEAWLPLLKDIGMMVVNALANFISGVFV